MEVSHRMTCVLVVDDDATIRSLLADGLADEGYQVTTSVNGKEALEVIRGGHRPAAMVVDLMMPVMDGWTLIRECRRLSSCDGVPIVVLSAAHDAASSVRDLGTQAFLPKPFDFDELLATIARLSGEVSA